MEKFDSSEYFAGGDDVEEENPLDLIPDLPTVDIDHGDISDNADDDYLSARKSLANLIAAAQAPLEQMYKTAMHTGAARDFEVYTAHLKVIAGLHKDMLKLTTETKNIKKEDTPQQNILIQGDVNNTNNTQINVEFSGSTENLMSTIAKMIEVK